MEPRRIKDLAQRLDDDLYVEIAEGLALIIENAARIWQAVPVLAAQKHARAARILEGHALEEAAKYLILLDAVRCPRQPADRFAVHLRKFNSHLARCLYAQVCDWRLTDFKEVRVNIERECQKYYLDGPNDVDWIFRNQTISAREGALYVDYVAYEERHEWVSPKVLEEVSGGVFFNSEPEALRLIRAIDDAGFSNPNALAVVSEIWRPLRFEDKADFRMLRAQIMDTFGVLVEKGLLRQDEAIQAYIVDRWPFPLYDLPMEEIKTDKESLKAIQRRSLMTP